MVKPWENVSIYASYIQGLQAGQTINEATYANPGVLPPFVSKQYEAGVKVDWGMVTTTFAAFQITQPNTTITPAARPGDLPTLDLDGEQRNRGVEINAYGEIVEGVRLLGGVTFLDAVQTKTTGGALDGERAYGAPKVRLVIGGEWDTPFVDGLTLTGRVTHTSDQVVVNSRPDLKIPSWTTVDLGARYVLLSPVDDKPITLRFNVDNVFDKNYWKGGFSNGFLSLSDPRTYRLSTTFTF
ncbi:TonB-dependent receptor [Chenggangzhangella methanolivorans]|uniref:TonB-dependent receptor n=1 Tax=Chenggangzhangella methanolivorans TaxID=1437009 RepID=A0A9E6R6B8_9HYPH|nr:TonB-dependent receptor [Chenggangzhangella methanolivorans]QZN99032.1 TonB-dependent receptor [Chenggangzhangella methanolivorans]